MLWSFERSAHSTDACVITSETHKESCIYLKVAKGILKRLLKSRFSNNLIIGWQLTQLEVHLLRDKTFFLSSSLSCLERAVNSLYRLNMQSGRFSVLLIYIVFTHCLFVFLEFISEYSKIYKNETSPSEVLPNIPEVVLLTNYVLDSVDLPKNFYELPAKEASIRFFLSVFIYSKTERIHLKTE